MTLDLLYNLNQTENRANYTNFIVSEQISDIAESFNCWVKREVKIYTKRSKQSSYITILLRKMFCFIYN